MSKTPTELLAHLDELDADAIHAVVDARIRLKSDLLIGAKRMAQDAAAERMSSAERNGLVTLAYNGAARACRRCGFHDGLAIAYLASAAENAMLAALAQDGINDSAKALLVGPLASASLPSTPDSGESPMPPTATKTPRPKADRKKGASPLKAAAERSAHKTSSRQKMQERLAKLYANQDVVRAAITSVEPTSPELAATLAKIESGELKPAMVVEPTETGGVEITLTEAGAAKIAELTGETVGQVKANAEAQNIKVAGSAKAPRWTVRVVELAPSGAYELRVVPSGRPVITKDRPAEGWATVEAAAAYATAKGWGVLCDL